MLSGKELDDVREWDELLLLISLEKKIIIKNSVWKATISQPQGCKFDSPLIDYLIPLLTDLDSTYCPFRSVGI